MNQFSKWTMKEVQEHEKSVAMKTAKQHNAPLIGELTTNETDRTPQNPQPEQPVLNREVGAVKGEEGNPSRIRVSVTSFRTALCDPDNLCPKYFIDCLRYAQIIPNDTSRDIALTVLQEKVATKAEERTEIEIWDRIPKLGHASACGINAPGGVSADPAPSTLV